MFQSVELLWNNMKIWDNIFPVSQLFGNFLCLHFRCICYSIHINNHINHTIKLQNKTSATTATTNSSSRLMSLCTSDQQIWLIKYKINYFVSTAAAYIVFYLTHWLQAAVNFVDVLTVVHSLPLVTFTDSWFDNGPPVSFFKTWVWSVWKRFGRNHVWQNGSRDAVYNISIIGGKTKITTLAQQKHDLYDWFREWLQCRCTAKHVTLYVYEGRFINKLQNGVILLIFRLWKFRNIHFVWDLILSMSHEFIAMTSLWCHL